MGRVERNTGERLRGRYGTRDRPPRSQLRAHLLRIASQRTGRVQIAVKRAFIAANNAPITVGDVLPRAFPRLRRYLHWHRWSVRRALLREAEVIARMRFGRGRPNLWQRTERVNRRGSE